jgi:hypothetical protein
MDDHEERTMRIRRWTKDWFKTEKCLNASRPRMGERRSNKR